MSKRRKYSEEFKREAVNLTRQPGSTRSGQEVCKSGQAAALPWAVGTGFPSLKM